MDDSLKIYVNKVSQPSCAVLAFCDLNGIKYERIEVDIYSGGLMTEEFRKVNPLMQIPVIIDNEYNLTECHAILRYLHATRKCDDHWYPSDPVERSKVDQLLDWHHTNLRQGCYGQLKRKIIMPLFGIEPREEEIKDLQKLLHLSLKFMNKILGINKFLTGENITIADLSLGFEVQSTPLVDVDLASKYPNVAKWMNRLKETPEINTIMKDMGVEKNTERMKAKI
ncbi:unnamed protein product [Moneuplotes crassus]|uniref:Uncharacterized protein n=1 Tax=Euplotes crassus TaxID=5936 RepID=A0AAD1XUW0_EUPCR|nr:unnamed protein product [Moneuplotes crassus]